MPDIHSIGSITVLPRGLGSVGRATAYDGNGFVEDRHLFVAFNGTMG